MHNITPANRKVLVAVTEAQLDSMPPHERSRINNQPGVEFLVIDGESGLAPAIAESILDQYAVDPGAVLIQNPFDTNRYLLQDEAVVEIALAKTIHVAHICHVLGSKSVKVTHVTSALDENEKHFSGKAGAKGAKLEGTASKSAADELKQRISLTDSGSGGEADIEAARAYVERYRLANDAVLTGLIDQRAVATNQFSGRDLTVDATREAKSSLSIASKLSIQGVVDAGLGGGGSSRKFDQINVTYEIRF